MNLDKSQIDQPTGFGRQFEPQTCGTNVMRRPYADECGFFGQGTGMNHVRTVDEHYANAVQLGFGQKSQGNIFFI